jgi:hypothetical protein
MRERNELNPYVKPRLYTVGLDLGQMADYSAISVLEAAPGESLELLNVRYLHRWPLGTAYPSIVEDVRKLMTGLPQADSRPVLAIDQTGCGAPVYDLFKQNAAGNWRLRGIHITGGSQVSMDRGITYVPKRDLVSVVAVGLQTHALKVADRLEHSETLRNELLNFKVKISQNGHDSYGAGDDWRSGNHDDLVLSVAMALWCARRAIPTVITVI